VAYAADPVVELEVACSSLCILLVRPVLPANCWFLTEDQSQLVHQRLTELAADQEGCAELQSMGGRILERMDIQDKQWVELRRGEAEIAIAQNRLAHCWKVRNAALSYVERMWKVMVRMDLFEIHPVKTGVPFAVLHMGAEGTLGKSLLERPFAVSQYR
jgi:hypothetical protein